MWQYAYMLDNFDYEHVRQFTDANYKQVKTFEERLKEMRKYFYTVA